MWLYFRYWITWNAIPNKYRSERIVLVGNKGLLGWWTRKWLASLAERDCGQECETSSARHWGIPSSAVHPWPWTTYPQWPVSGQHLCEMGSPLYVSPTNSWSLLPRSAASSSTEAPLSLVHPCRQSYVDSVFSAYSRTVVTPDPLELAPPPSSTISVDSPTQPMSSESPQESASVPITVYQVAAKSERRHERWAGRFIYVHLSLYIEHTVQKTHLPIVPLVDTLNSNVSLFVA